MHQKITFQQLSDKCICLLLILSMLLPSKIKIAGFPIYILLFLLTVSGWTAAKSFFDRKEEQPFIELRYRADIVAVITIIYEMFSAICKLFQNPQNGEIDFASNAEMIALALLCLLLSSGIPFKILYFDIILYGSLIITGMFLYPYFTGTETGNLTEMMFADSGAVSSLLLIPCMVSVYAYCTCKDKLRSWFYLLVAAISFFALFLNHNIISFWLMTVYFIMLPIVLRPTAWLVKRDMQLFFLFGFLLSNMSLLTGYTQVIQRELSYSLEHSVYLDLLLAVGGVFFFHYWEKIPEGIDLERLVMRKMRRGYQFVFQIILLLFIGITIGGDRWTQLPDGMFAEAVKGFAVPLAETIKQSESGFYFCFQHMGFVRSILLILFCTLIIGRLRRNYGMDKPLTGTLTLISGIFMVQLLFWKPAVHTLTVYFVLLLSAAFYKEEKMKVSSVKIREDVLQQQSKMPDFISAADGKVEN